MLEHYPAIATDGTRALERRVRVPIHASGPREGQPHTRALHAALQRAGLALHAASIRANLTLEPGTALLTITDASSDDTIALVRIPIGAGA